MAIHEMVIGAVVLFTLVSAWTDARTGHIPNWVVVAFAASAVALRIAAAFMSTPRMPLLAALGDQATTIALGAIACGLVPYALFRAGAMGGGDVKLLAAVGMALGPSSGIEVELASFVIASLYACGRLAYRGDLFRFLGNSLRLAVRPITPRDARPELSPDLLTSLRFAPSLFVAALVFAYGAWSVS